jgi:hypothetical protein
MASWGCLGHGFGQGERHLVSDFRHVVSHRTGFLDANDTHNTSLFERLTTHRYSMWLSVSRVISTRTPLACPMVILDTHMAVVTSIRSASYDRPALHHLPCSVQPSGPCGSATAHSISATTKQHEPPSRYRAHDVKDLHGRSNRLQRFSGTYRPALRKSLQLELHHSARSPQRFVTAQSRCYL